MSALCVEITPKERIHYEMPEWMADGMKRGFKLRLFKRMGTFVNMLPPEWKALVTITRHPNPPPEPPSRINWVFYDELASPEAIKMAVEYENRKRDKKV